MPKRQKKHLSKVFKDSLKNDKLTIKAAKLKNADIASVITLSEEGRRMQDMMKMYAMNGMGGMDTSMFAADQTLTLNTSHPLVQYILNHKDSEHVPMFCQQLYDLAVLSNQPLSVDAMTKFVQRQQRYHDAAGKIKVQEKLPKRESDFHQIPFIVASGRFCRFFLLLFYSSN